MEKSMLFAAKMKRMLIALIALALAAAAFFAVLCGGGTIETASAAVTKREIGLKIDPTNQTETNAAQGWAWNKETATLTLNNADFGVMGDSTLSFSGIENVTIVLAEGSVNNLKSQSNGPSDRVALRAGVSLDGNLTIKGSGRLTIDAQQYFAETSGSTDATGIGLRFETASSTLHITGGAQVGTFGAIALSEDATSKLVASYGIDMYHDGKLLVDKGASLLAWGNNAGPDDKNNPNATNLTLESRGVNGASSIVLEKGYIEVSTIKYTGAAAQMTAQALCVAVTDKSGTALSPEAGAGAWNTPNCQYRSEGSSRTLTFDGNGHTGGTLPAEAEYDSGKEVTIPVIDITKPGLTLSGWQVSGAGTVYKAGDKIVLAEDTILKAKWAHICGGVTYDIALTAEEITKAEGQLTAGNYYLAEDIALTSKNKTFADYSFGAAPDTSYGLGFKGKASNLCLNGHKLTAESRKDSVIYLDMELPETQCSVNDCNGANLSHAYSKNETTGLFQFSASGAQSVSGGVITGGAYGIYVFEGTLNFQGGTVAGNGSDKSSDIDPSNDAGAGIFVNGGAVTGALDFSGGAVEGNVGFVGGGVTAAGNMTMSGGAVRNNYSVSDGGGIIISRDFKMTGGTIDSNRAGGSGGGLHGYSTGKPSIELVAGRITNNTAVLFGAGIYISNMGEITIGNEDGVVQNLVVTGNVAKQVKNGKRQNEGVGAGAYINNKLILRGNPKIKDNKSGDDTLGRIDSNLYSMSLPIKVEKLCTFDDGKKYAEIGINAMNSIFIGYDFKAITEGYGFESGGNNEGIDPATIFSSDNPGRGIGTRDVGGIMEAVFLKAYSLTYSANGATGTTPTDSKQYKVDGSESATILDKGDLTKTGMTFVGWNTKADGSGTTYQPGATLSMNSSFTLYAQWATTFSMTYDANGATGTAPADSKQYKVDGSESATILDKGDLTKAGFIFTGWNTKADGSGTNYAVGATLPMNASVTLYAQWAENFTITYYENGAVGSVPTDSKEYSPVAPYESATILDKGNLTKAGMTFIGWNTKADGSGTKYAAGATLPMNASLDLHAQWSAVTPSFNNGVSQMEGLQGTPFTDAVIAQASAAGAGVKYSLVNAPAGVSIDITSGVITINGAVAMGKHSFTVRVVNTLDESKYAEKTVHLNIVGLNDKNTVSGTVTGETDKPLDIPVNGLEGDETITYSPAENGYYTDTKPMFTKPGTYEYWVKISKPGYQDKKSKVIVTITGEDPEPTFEITGTVEDADDNAVPNALVIVRAGSKTFGTAETDANGKFSFKDLPKNLYNLVVVYGETTATTVIDLKNNSDKTIKLPKLRLNSIVDVKEGVTDIVVDGLNDLFSEQDKALVGDAAKSVEMKLQVAAVSDKDVSVGIKKALENYGGNYLLDITLLKTMKLNGNVDSSDRITTADGLLKIIIPLPQYLQGKSGYGVVRDHEGAIQTLTDKANADGEYIEVKDGNTVIVHTKNFSQYAIVYDKETTGGAGGFKDVGDCFAHWLMILVLVAYIVFLLLWYVILRRQRLDFISFLVTAAFILFNVFNTFMIGCLLCLVLMIVSWLINIFGALLFIFGKKVIDKQKEKYYENNPEKKKEAEKKQREKNRIASVKFAENMAAKEAKAAAKAESAAAEGVNAAGAAKEAEDEESSRSGRRTRRNDGYQPFRRVQDDPSRADTLVQKDEQENHHQLLKYQVQQRRCAERTAEFHLDGTAAGGHALCAAGHRVRRRKSGIHKGDKTFARRMLRICVRAVRRQDYAVIKDERRPCAGYSGQRA